MGSLKQRFGLLLAAQRKAAGFTQQQLAEKCQLSVDMISKVEAGRAAPSFATIERLAEALSSDPSEFFSASRHEKPARRLLVDLNARLTGLPDNELAWLIALVETALKPR